MMNDETFWRSLLVLLPCHWCIKDFLETKCSVPIMKTLPFAIIEGKTTMGGNWG